MSNSPTPNPVNSRLPETITAIATLIGTLVAAFLSLYALYQSSNSLHQSSKNTSEIALNQKAISKIDTDIRTPAAQTAMVTSEAPIIVVQLATYLARHCDTAQDEIASYSDQFKPSPSLWTVPNSGSIVIGVRAASSDEAAGIKAKAQAMAKDPRFSNEDLGNAVVRTNPGWKPVASCADVHP